jgi:lipopolysaccharide transport system permease protein
MLGQVQWATGFVLLLFNIFGIWVALKLLNRERPNLPFLI